MGYGLQRDGLGIYYRVKLWTCGETYYILRSAYKIVHQGDKQKDPYGLNSGFQMK